MKIQPSKMTYSLSFLVLVILDQLSKYIVRLNGGFYICNKNLAFGIKFMPSILIITGILFFIFLLTTFKSSKFKVQSSNQFQILKINKRFFDIWIFDLIWNNLDFGFLLIISGGLSNIIDRLYLGCVVDFIDLRFWPVFNLADIYITFGVILVLINHLKSKKEINF